MFYVVFARYDASFDDGDGGSFCDSGRTCYITDDALDAERCWTYWNDDPDSTDDLWFSVRRGGITSYPTLVDAWTSDPCSASTEHDCRTGCEDPTPPPTRTGTGYSAHSIQW